ncbi:DUF2808 domain-containing protein [Aerosakkonemataceae cyanobacterium BLCC-F154]|uniref:DUF2808 domain-containing protein n=1 Tax=Floridaenema fluviatile BLCC-F154 TaxID=3153640 RepID=A0ABV4YKE4_9CYAN
MSKAFTKFIISPRNAYFLSAGTLLLGLFLPTPLLTSPTVASPLYKQETSSSSSCRLVRAATSCYQINVPATYHFTIQVPKNGRPLQAVSIAQKDNAETIRFDLSKNRAFIGGSFAGGPELPLASIGGSEVADPSVITVVFDRPVAPGEKVTVALQAEQNPQLVGDYLFEVTAFPVGSDRAGIDLGVTNLHFDSE